MPGLVPGIPIHEARLCPPERNHRDKPGVMTDWQGLSTVMPALVAGMTMAKPMRFSSWPGTAVAMRSYVMAGLVPAIPIHGAPLCAPERDHRDKPGDDGMPSIPQYNLRNDGPSNYSMPCCE
jgi:hypothetical protein